MDDYGRYTLAEMYTVVRRKVDMYRAVVSPTTGVEGGVLQVSPLASNDDIKVYLNTALIKRMIDISVLDNTIMADEEKIDIVANQVEYELPADLLFLRGVYFKPRGETYTEIPPNQRIYLYEYDQDNDIAEILIDAPTYRRRLNTIVLNQVPGESNTGGLIVDYVKGPMPLRTDDQVIETPLAFILQEVIILDTVIYIVTERMQLTAQELRVSLKDLETRLSLAATNYHAPKLVRLVNPIQLAYPPTGRRRTWSRAGRWFW